jgi:energy-coupling factor transport system ATP-binding protein
MPENSNNLPVSIRNLSFTYRIRKEPAIKDINLDLHPGELMLIAGKSGCGKTTLMRCVNGLIPRSYYGTLEGDINLFGKLMTSMSMSELSQIVGTILQNPERQIVASFVLNEVAFGLENLGVPRAEIIDRVDKALEDLNIMHLRERETFSLSGGEKQKVALAGVLIMRPKILLLDEPLASLDPASAREALEQFRELANRGISIMLVEHRVDDVLAINPDTVVYLDDGEIKYIGEPDGMMETADYKNIKLPANVIMQRAKYDPPILYKPQVGVTDHKESVGPLLSFQNVEFRYADDLPTVLHDVSFEVTKGDIVAILGPNGAGKTTLVKHALGLLKPISGQVFLDGTNTEDIPVSRAAHTIGYVFQDPGQMLFAPSVEEELAFGPKNLRHPEQEIKKNVDWALNTVNINDLRNDPPLALSFGQQKRVSIAAILSMRSRILVMDEPTAGQDYWNYRAFMDSILQMPGFDSVLFITHDLDLAVTYATHVLLLSEGSVAAFGPAHDVLVNEQRLRQCRVLPTTLLKLNIEYLSKTGSFMRAEQLAHIVD